jgi:hypothetical protein
MAKRKPGVTHHKKYPSLGQPGACTIIKLQL